MSDGPAGIRGTRFFQSVPAAAIPCGSALGATWDKGLVKEAGELLGKECIAKGVHCWLGPTVNIQRSPLGGRNNESFGEDPHLMGILGSAMIDGCQSTGVAATIKHFVCNDQEDEKSSLNAIVTQRALRELYLRPFQIAARDVNPEALMTAYNKLNGFHCSEHPLLEHVVRGEWNWDPLIMSDWYVARPSTL
jgi:beta-glucosidase